MLGGIWSLLTRQQVDGCSSQLDLLAMEVKMLRRELARHSITNEKGIADSFVYSSGEGLAVGQGKAMISQSVGYCYSTAIKMHIFKSYYSSSSTRNLPLLMQPNFHPKKWARLHVETI